MNSLSKATTPPNSWRSGIILKNLMDNFSKSLRTAALIVSLLIGSLAGSAQDLNLRKLDAYIKAAMVDHDIPGLAIGIVKDGAVVYQKGYGVKSELEGGAITTNTMFGIASLSKAFTAAAVGKLAKYFAEHGNVTTDKQTAEDVFAFLQRANSNLSDLNEFNDASFFLINVPNSTRVRVLYGIRSTTDTPLNPDATRKLRFLTQDLPDETAKAPGVLELPTSVRDKVTMANKQTQ